MKKSLMCGTATTLLITTTLLSGGMEEAFAANGAWADPNERLETAYGVPVIERTSQFEEITEITEITEETSKLSSLALDIAMGAALTAAGVDLAYRMSRHSDSKSRQEPDGSDATQDDSTSSSVDSGGMTDE